MIMATIYCSNCGSDNEDTGKFCRKCGQPMSLSEATTRKFDTGPQVEAPTSLVNQTTTGPSYVPPSMPVFRAPATQALAPPNQKKPILMLASLAAILLVALVALVILTSQMRRELASPPPGGSGSPPGAAAPPPPPDPSGGAIPHIPHIPPVPPMPPTVAPPKAPAPPPSSGAAKEAGGELKYPGSAVIMEMPGGNGHGMIQLHTTDPVEKVADWYISRMKSPKIIRAPYSVILSADRLR